MALICVPWTSYTLYGFGSYGDSCFVAFLLAMTRSPTPMLCSLTYLPLSFWRFMRSLASLSTFLASTMSSLSLAGFALRSGRRVLNFLPNSSSAGHFFMVLCGVALCCIRYSLSLM